MVSRFTVRRSSNEVFFRGEKKSPWYLVAFGMVGASISGITFVSVPGMVLHSNMTYVQTCLGFILGYVAVAFILLPIYYRQNLTTIYSYLSNVSPIAYKTGSSFFIISKLLGSAAKFYVPCFILSNALGWNLTLTIMLLLLMVWLYTRKGGIKTLVWTDTIQTTSMLLALLIIIYKVVVLVMEGQVMEGQVMGDGGMSFSEVISNLWSNPHSTVFNFSDFSSSTNFFKCFISGIFIVIVMTGLDQDMMQKNLTCKSLRDAQKDMTTYGFAFVPVNILFLLLGVLLTMLYTKQGIALPEKADELVTMFCVGDTADILVLTLFTIGIIAASFSTVDSALTALTTSFCVDILSGKTDEPQDHTTEQPYNHKTEQPYNHKTEQPYNHKTEQPYNRITEQPYNHKTEQPYNRKTEQPHNRITETTSERTRKVVHIAMTGALILCVLLFDALNTTSLIDAIYTLMSYTYGPLLGLFAFAIFTKRKASGIGLPLACIISPAICLALSTYVPEYTGYHFGYELLLLNGMLTFAGLFLISKVRQSH